MPNSSSSTKVKKPTIADVAKQAGVSVFTASRVVNNEPSVSSELRRKVSEAVR